MNHIIVKTPKGDLQSLSVSEELLAANPDLKAAVDRIKNATRAGSYGESYEKNPAHDKYFEKVPGYDKQHSRANQ